MLKCCLVFLKKKDYLFLDRGEGREKERERNINVWLSLTCPFTRDPAHNPGMCLDWELNQQRFGFQASTQSTEPHEPGLSSVPKCKKAVMCLKYVY